MGNVAERNPVLAALTPEFDERRAQSGTWWQPQDDPPTGVSRAPDPRFQLVGHGGFLEDAECLWRRFRKAVGAGWHRNGLHGGWDPACR